LFEKEGLLYKQEDLTYWPDLPYLDQDLEWESSSDKHYMYIHLKSELFESLRFDDRFWSYDVHEEKVYLVLMDIKGWDEFCARSAGVQ